MKRENNVIFGNSHGDKLISDAVIESVMMEPDFTVANFGFLANRSIDKNGEILRFRALSLDQEMISLKDLTQII